MLNTRLEVPNSNRLYSSTVSDSRKPSSSMYQKRNTVIAPDTPPANKYLTPSYTPSFRNSKKEDNNLLRVTVSTMDQAEDIVSKTRDQLSKSQAFRTETHSRSSRKYQDASTDRDIFYEEGKREPLSSDWNRDTKLGDKGVQYEKLREKLNKKEQIIKELKKLCETKVSDNIRGHPYDKDKTEIYSPVRAKRYTDNKLMVSGPNEGIRSTMEAPSSFKLDLPGSSAHDKKCQEYLEKKQLKIVSPVRKGSEFVPSKRNPEDFLLGKEGFQLSKVDYAPKQVKTTIEAESEEQYKIVVSRGIINLEKDTTDAFANTSGLTLFKNVSDISACPIQSFSSLRARRSKEEEAKEQKYLKDVRQLTEQKTVKGSRGSFGGKRITINDFQLKKNLGEGKFGVVYQAFHKETNSLYALKKISKKVIKSNHMEDQFLLEVKIQSFCNHENILKIYGQFDDPQNIYLILEYMQEGTLFSQLKVKKTLDEEEAAVSLKHIVKAVIYLHENGIAHRDIKPENIVMSNKVGKLCDFGWAAICTDRRKTYCGTFDYVAPEILEGAQYDATVDLWCLGVLAYELLVGKAPFYHISRKETMKKIMNVQKIEFPPNISGDAVSFIEGLIKKNPEERMFGSDILRHPFLAKVRDTPE